MTIKQLGGVFGRNPTFNDVTIEGQLTFDGDIDINSDLKVDGDLDVTGTAKVNSFIAGATSTPQANAEIKDATGGELRLSTSEPSMVANDVAGKITWNAPDEGSGTQANIVAGEISLIATDFWDVTRYTPSAIVFKTCPLNGPEIVEAARFNSSGNLAFPSGQGIDFSATAGTGTSELFDDYEEGTWTPVAADALSGGNTGTASTATGNYTKVGNLVNVIGVLININTSGLTAGNNFCIQGLPYPSSDVPLTSAYFISGGVYVSSITKSSNLVTFFADNGSSAFNLIDDSGYILVSDLTSGAADVYFSFSYQAT